MKKMLVFSVVFHFTFATVLFAVSASWRRVFVLQEVYQVNLVTLPSPPKPEAPIAVPIPQPLPLPPSPKPVTKKKPEPDKPKAIAKALPELDSKSQAKSKETIKKEIDKTTVEQPGTAEDSNLDPKTASIPPAPSVEVEVDAPNFEFPFYLKIIRGKISSAWSPPVIKTGDVRTEVVVSFTLITTGKVESIEIEKSSGNTFFDQAALRAVYLASPFPPLPREFQEPNLKIHFSFSLIRHG
jgi:TonB family protein